MEYKSWPEGNKGLFSQVKKMVKPKLNLHWKNHLPIENSITLVVAKVWVDPLTTLAGSG
jgi:hypothetical protein